MTRRESEEDERMARDFLLCLGGVVAGAFIAMFVESMFGRPLAAAMTLVLLLMVVLGAVLRQCDRAGGRR